MTINSFDLLIDLTNELSEQMGREESGIEMDKVHHRGITVGLLRAISIIRKYQKEV